jgi:hypothetical protein
MAAVQYFMIPGWLWFNQVRNNLKPSLPTDP